jgi:hypothetical protein
MTGLYDWGDSLSWPRPAESERALSSHTHMPAVSRESQNGAAQQIRGRQDVLEANLQAKECERRSVKIHKKMCSVILCK